MKTAIALSIAGSDPSGGAGLQADLKVFQHLAVYGMGLISLHTVQNSTGVFAVENVHAELLEKQLRTLLRDIRPDAIKIGALGDLLQIEVLEKELRNANIPIILDPVFSSSNKHRFLDPSCKKAFKEKLLANCFLVTPNIPEAEELIEGKIEDLNSLKVAAKKIAEMGAQNVLIKGGHSNSGSCLDLLYTNSEYHFFEKERLANKEVHGTGCILSAAIVAQLAKGNNLFDALGVAKEFVHRAIKNSQKLGHGASLASFHNLPSSYVS